MRHRLLTLAVAAVVSWAVFGSETQNSSGGRPQPQAAEAAPRLQPDPNRAGPLPPGLLARLQKDPYAYFRFVNKAWARRVCAEFGPDLPTLTRVRLHGDAHLEQYAFTSEAYGLDDFDDTADGPSVIDAVRFLGSLDLAARQR